MFVAMLVPVLVPLLSCGASKPGSEATEPPAEDYRKERERMVKTQIAPRGIEDDAVLSAMRTVPRHRYMPRDTWSAAYNDHAVGIGERQTISQPYIVALMTELAEVKPGEKVLEVGTGSGYQAAVLAEVGAEVYSIEIVETLAVRAREALDATGYERVQTRTGDGYRGWPDQAPFDAVVITAAPDHVPQPLLDQLAVGGHMVIPVGRYSQELLRITRTPDGYERQPIVPVMFVPMTGEAQRQ